MNNKQRLCIPEGSFVSGSCRYWHDYQVDALTRITIQKCDFDRLFFACVSIMKENGTIWQRDCRGKTAFEALKNAHKLLAEMRSE